MATFRKATLTASAKDAVTFDKLKRRMVYELSNWSNSATAAHVSSRLFARRSRTGRLGHF